MIGESTRQRFERSTLRRLRALKRRLRWYLVLDGAAVVSAALLASVLVTLGADWTLRLGWDMRLTQLATLLIVIAVVVWRVIVRPLRVPICNEHMALLVERRCPDLQSRLISAVEFSDPRLVGPLRAVRPCPAMIEAVVRQAEEEAAHLRFRDTLNHGRARRRGAATIVCLGALVLLTMSAPETMGRWFRRNVLLANADWPQRNQLTVEGLTDGKMVVPRGDDATISAVVDEGFEPPRQAYLRYEGDSGLRGREQMPAVRAETIRFTHTFERIDETLHCQITGGDAVTDWFTIEVVDRPRLSGVRLGIVPPRYTNLEPYELRAGQTVAEGLKGSGIRFHITTNKAVAKANLIRQIGGEKTDLGPAERIGEQAFAGSDRPGATATYHFLLADETGLTNLSERVPPVRFTVRLMADTPPKVKMKIKGLGEMVTPEAVLPIETDFSDVYGLASAELLYAPSGSGAEPAAITEPMPGFEIGTKTFARTLDWSVATHGLAEGDRFSLHAQASDFDDVSGPNVGKSATVVLRVVSRDELLGELDRREQEYRQDFERILRQQEELYSDLLTWSGVLDSQVDPQKRGQQFARLARRQRDQAGRLTTLRMQFEQVLSELRVNQLSSPAIERRLGGGVIEPINALARAGMPEAAERLDDLSQGETPERIQAARDAQDALLASMRAILDSMRKWEGFQEAVILLRDVLKMQRKLIRETERRVESEIFGTEPAREPSKE